MSLFILVFSAIQAAFVWRTPDLSDAAPLIAMGVLGYATHYCVTRSMAAADASFVVPFDFLRLPLSAGFGYVLFAERQASPLRPADGAEQHRVRVLRLFQRLIRQGRAMGVMGTAAEQTLGDVEGNGAAAVEPVHHPSDLADHLGPDAVARKHQ